MINKPMAPEATARALSWQRHTHNLPARGDQANGLTAETSSFLTATEALLKHSTHGNQRFGKGMLIFAERNRTLDNHLSTIHTHSQVLLSNTTRQADAEKAHNLITTGPSTLGSNRKGNSHMLIKPHANQQHSQRKTNNPNQTTS